MTVREQLLRTIHPYQRVALSANLTFLIGMLGVGIFQSSSPTLLFVPCILVGLVVGVASILVRNRRVRCPRCGSSIQQWFSYTNNLYSYTIPTSAEACQGCQLALGDPATDEPRVDSRKTEFQHEHAR